MSKKMLTPIGSTLGGGAVYGTHAYNYTKDLKRLPGETDEDFRARRRRLILSNTISGALAGGVIGHGYSYNKGQMLGSGLGLATSEMMSSDDVNFKDMSANAQDEHMRLKSNARLLGSLGGGLAGRIAGTDKVPGLNKRASLRERLINFT